MNFNNKEYQSQYEETLVLLEVDRIDNHDGFCDCSSCLGLLDDAVFNEQFYGKEN